MRQFLMAILSICLIGVNAYGNDYQAQSSYQNSGQGSRDMRCCPCAYPPTQPNPYRPFITSGIYPGYLRPSQIRYVSDQQGNTDNYRAPQSQGQYGQVQQPQSSSDSGTYQQQQPQYNPQQATYGWPASNQNVNPPSNLAGQNGDENCDHSVNPNTPAAAPSNYQTTSTSTTSGYYTSDSTSSTASPLIDPIQDHLNDPANQDQTNQDSNQNSIPSQSQGSQYQNTDQNAPSYPQDTYYGYQPTNGQGVQVTSTLTPPNTNYNSPSSGQPTYTYSNSQPSQSQGYPSDQSLLKDSSNYPPSSANPAQTQGQYQQQLPYYSVQTGNGGDGRSFQSQDQYQNQPISYQDDTNQAQYQPGSFQVQNPILPCSNITTHPVDPNQQVHELFPIFPNSTESSSTDHLNITTTPHPDYESDFDILSGHNSTSGANSTTISANNETTTIKTTH